MLVDQGRNLFHRRIACLLLGDAGFLVNVERLQASYTAVWLIKENTTIMTFVLLDLEPKEVWRHFEALTVCNRVSGGHRKGSRKARTSRRA